MGWRARLIVLLAALVALASPSVAQARVGPHFFGAIHNAYWPVPASDLDNMDQGRVGGVRWVVYWSAVEPIPGTFRWSIPDAVVGAGTVTKIEDIAAASKAGAKYLVSPGTSADFAAALAEAAVPVIPGCATVSEAMALAAHGFTVLKFFPAEASGGIGWLKAVAAPLPNLSFCPTGGIDSRNAESYLAQPNVAAVGGSWVTPKDAIAAGDYARITALARAAAGLRGRQK